MLDILKLICLIPGLFLGGSGIGLVLLALDTLWRQKPIDTLWRQKPIDTLWRQKPIDTLWRQKPADDLPSPANLLLLGPFLMAVAVSWFFFIGWVF